MKNEKKNRQNRRIRLPQNARSLRVTEVRAQSQLCSVVRWIIGEKKRRVTLRDRVRDKKKLHASDVCAENGNENER